jgi:hypothetical protein
MKNEDLDEIHKKILHKFVHSFICCSVTFNFGLGPCNFCSN